MNSFVFREVGKRIIQENTDTEQLVRCVKLRDVWKQRYCYGKGRRGEPETDLE